MLRRALPLLAALTATLAGLVHADRRPEDRAGVRAGAAREGVLRPRGRLSREAPEREVDAGRDPHGHRLRVRPASDRRGGEDRRPGPAQGVARAGAGPARDVHQGAAQPRARLRGAGATGPPARRARPPGGPARRGERGQGREERQARRGADVVRPGPRGLHQGRRTAHGRVQGVSQLPPRRRPAKAEARTQPRGHDGCRAPEGDRRLRAGADLSRPAPRSGPTTWPRGSSSSRRSTRATGPSGPV